MCFHGKWSVPERACRAFCTPYADQLGARAVCLDGTNANGASGWNTGDDVYVNENDSNGQLEWWRTTELQDRDDVSFVQGLQSALQNAGFVNFYAMGFSMGGGMVYRLACETPDLFHGFVIWSQAGPAGGSSANTAGTGNDTDWWNNGCAISSHTRNIWVGIDACDNNQFWNPISVETGWRGFTTTVSELNQASSCTETGSTIVQQATCKDMTCSGSSQDTYSTFCLYAGADSTTNGNCHRIATHDGLGSYHVHSAVRATTYAIEKIRTWDALPPHPPAPPSNSPVSIYGTIYSHMTYSPIPINPESGSGDPNYSTGYLSAMYNLLYGGYIPPPPPPPPPP